MNITENISNSTEKFSHCCKKKKRATNQDFQLSLNFIIIPDYEPLTAL